MDNYRRTSDDKVVYYPEGKQSFTTPDELIVRGFYDEFGNINGKSLVKIMNAQGLAGRRVEIKIVTYD